MRRHQGQASQPAVGIEQFKADKVLFKDWLHRVKESSTSRNEHFYVDRKPSKQRVQVKSGDGMTDESSLGLR